MQLQASFYASKYLLTLKENKGMWQICLSDLRGIDAVPGLTPLAKTTSDCQVWLVYGTPAVTVLSIYVIFQAVELRPILADI